MSPSKIGMGSKDYSMRKDMKSPMFLFCTLALTATTAACNEGVGNKDADAGADADVQEGEDTLDAVPDPVVETDVEAADIVPDPVAEPDAEVGDVIADPDAEPDIETDPEPNPEPDAETDVIDVEEDESVEDTIFDTIEDSIEEPVEDLVTDTVEDGFLRVFITSSREQGDFGGASGADSICQSVADSAGLGGTWKAWVSDATSSPASRFNHSTVPYLRLDSVQIAGSWDDLTDAVLDAPITIQEDGNILWTLASGLDLAWTGTTAAGAQDAGSNCLNWTTASPDSWIDGATGRASRTDAWWTQTGGASYCYSSRHFYCFEQ